MSEVDNDIGGARLRLADALGDEYDPRGICELVDAAIARIEWLNKEMDRISDFYTNRLVEAAIALDDERSKTRGDNTGPLMKALRDIGAIVEEFV